MEETRYGVTAEEAGKAMNRMRRIAEVAKTCTVKDVADDPEHAARALHAMGHVMLELIDGSTHPSTPSALAEGMGPMPDDEQAGIDAIHVRILERIEASQPGLTEERRRELREMAAAFKRKVDVSRGGPYPLLMGVDPAELLALLDERLTPSEAGAIQAVSEVERLSKAATYAAAELRHAYRTHGLRGGRIDPGLVSRAIAALEAATAQSTTPALRVFTEAEVREVLKRHHADAESNRCECWDDTDSSVYVNATGRKTACEDVARSLNLTLD